jgi:hypothetical protein
MLPVPRAPMSGPAFDVRLFLCATGAVAGPVAALGTADMIFGQGSATRAVAAYGLSLLIGYGLYEVFSRAGYGRNRPANPAADDEDRP